MDKRDAEVRTGGERPCITVETFTEGKGGPEADPRKNEDVVIADATCVVLADGSTTKNKQLAAAFEAAFNGLSGGRVAAEVVAKTAHESGLDGRELVDAISGSLFDIYQTRFPQALDDHGQLKPEMAMATTFVSARVDKEAGELVVTRVGDTSYRITFIDGSQKLFRDEREIDAVDAKDRAKAIEAALAAGDSEEVAIPKGREAIMDSLNRQAKEYWNNPDSKYGFGYVTGADVPDKFVQVERFDLDKVAVVEILSDGYTYAPEEELPIESTIEAWEEHIADVHAKDPSKYKRYLSTKPSDDRGIAIVRIKH